MLIDDAFIAQIGGDAAKNGSIGPRSPIIIVVVSNDDTTVWNLSTEYIYIRVKLLPKCSFQKLNRAETWDILVSYTQNNVYV